MAATNLTADLERIIQETLHPTIMEYRTEIDPFTKYIVPDDSAYMDPGISRDWKCRRVIETGLAGAVEYDDMQGNNVLTDSSIGNTLAAGLSDNFTLYGESIGSTWPGLNEAPAPSYLEMQIQLKQFKGNLFVPAKIQRLAALGASIGNQMRATIRGMARNINLALANAFWAEGSATSGLERHIASFTTANDAKSRFIKSGGTFRDEATDQLEKQSIGTGQIRRLYDGYRCDILNASAVRQNAADQPVFIDNVDPLADSFNMKIKTGANITLAANTQYFIVPRKSSPSGSATSATSASGLVDWIVSTGTLANIPLHQFPFLRSYVISSVGGALDEETLSGYLARCESALGNLFQVDTLVATPGVWVSYFENMSDGTNDVLYLQTQRRVGNEPRGINHGYDTENIRFTYGGKTYNVASSPFCHSGNCWGLKTRDNNFKMIIPPTLPGTSRDSAFHKGIEFMAKWMYPGLNSIFFSAPNPVAPVGQPTDVLQAPFVMPHEFWPDYLPGMRLQGITDTLGTVASAAVPAS